MNGTDMHQWFNSAGTVLAILGILWVAAVKLTKLEVKVDIIWGTLLKRALVDGVAHGHMEVNSPVRLVNDSGKLLEHMAPELQEFYQENCPQGCNEKEAALLIEKKFGDRLIKEVCIPNGISNLVCILIALAVAKNTGSLTEILDQTLSEEKPAAVATSGAPTEEAVD